MVVLREARTDQPRLADCQPGRVMVSLTARKGVRRRVGNYALAVLVVAFAVAFCWLLYPILGGELTYPTLYPAIAAVAWFAGWQEALFAMVIGYLALDWFFIPPLGTLGVVSTAQWIDLITFCTGGFIIVFFGELTQRARRKAEDRTAEAEALLETAPVGPT